MSIAIIGVFICRLFMHVMPHEISKWVLYSLVCWHIHADLHTKNGTGNIFVLILTLLVASKARERQRDTKFKSIKVFGLHGSTNVTYLSIIYAQHSSNTVRPKTNII